MLIKLKKKNIVSTAKISLKHFNEIRNKVLIIRYARGMGDILMCRMILEDFKRMMPDAYLVFACPAGYHDLLKNHPFLDEIVDSDTVNRSDYLISYDISKCCIWWESMHSPHADKHRADIWAEHCGVTLQNHNMYLPCISNEMINQGKAQIKKINTKNQKTVFFNPFAHDNLRTLQPHQIEGVVSYLQEKFFVFASYFQKSYLLSKLGVMSFYGLNTIQWLSLIHAADYVVTVDTAVFHYAGGISKPLTGIFTHADGKYRGQYYDFVLVQKHRDDGWECGPCYNHIMCTNPRCATPKANNIAKPCLTELTVDEIIVGIEKMLAKWAK